MNYLRILLVLLSASTLSAQASQLTVTAKGCSALHLYQFNGAGFDTEMDLVKGSDGTFTLDFAYDEAKFRYLGPAPKDALPVLLVPGEQPSVTATCGQMKRAKVAGSPANDGYQELKKQFQVQNGKFSTATRSYQKAMTAGDSAAMQTHLATLADIDQQKQQLMERLQKETPILGRIATLNTYKSYLTSNQGRFSNELDYFVNTYFENVDWNDKGYNDLPWSYEGNRNFTNTLAGAVKGENLADILMQVNSQWPEGSRAQLFALSGAFAALAQKKHPAAVKLADAIEKRFAADYPAPVKQIKQQAAGLRTFSVGAEAPLFTSESPEGENISLESLRGKVVLIDFWASWCGPCRRENPNVVKVYEKYKDQGFEILAVSLDSNRDRWLKAIADDNLTWLHVSELKGWKSTVGRLYGVSSIPQTVLLDAEGRILARNLRGAALEQKLAQVFAGK
ncbi:TlpA disulfide reductase family protein [Lewinella sp. 4G2]|uniref:TlpA family protein disulfide reductase n=1 Tax=Lewinella sp. 4G2 TaxID=1803372 RepID=UPI0007B4A01E|nr:TlpA disulfide reductase family protein [Lewinella sp. 4G2]OAV44871.1 hypothetical protein A3850_010375 [Lewinella sp. 4G2]